MKKQLQVLLILFLTIGCAGPMTPFGSIEINDLISSAHSKVHYPSSISNSKKAKVQKITISPSRLNLHEDKKLIIKIHGEKEQALSQTRFFYNGFDITKKVLELATIRQEKQTLIYTIKDMVFLAKDDHSFSVSYSKNSFDTPYIKHYLYPICPLTGSDDVFASSTNKSRNSTLNKIINISKNYKINPNLLAGLVAQESSFNPKAISYAKAIGLTQVTSLAEEHIINKYKQWPRYPNIKIMSYLKTKSLISLGKINKNNEWRLNPEMSIIGGMEYLKYLNTYWSKDKHKSLIEKTYRNYNNEILSDIILASYNSGAFRVKTQIKKKGQKWKNGKNLKEAKKYIRKVKSYCYQFSGN